MRDVRAALALHDSWFDHTWQIDSTPGATGWWDARCAKCGCRLEPLFHHSRAMNNPLKKQ